MAPPLVEEKYQCLEFDKNSRLTNYFEIFQRHFHHTTEPTHTQHTPKQLIQRCPVTKSFVTPA